MTTGPVSIFPLEPAPLPDAHAISGRMMRSKVIRAIFQQYEAGDQCSRVLDRLILFGVAHPQGVYSGVSKG